MSSQSAQIRISGWECWTVGRSLQNSFHVHRSLATVPFPCPFFSLHATNKPAVLIQMKKNSVASTCFSYHPIIKMTALTCAKSWGLFLIPHSYLILIWKVCWNIILPNVYFPACFASCIFELVKFQYWDGLGPSAYYSLGQQQYRLYTMKWSQLSKSFSLFMIFPFHYFLLNFLNKERDVVVHAYNSHIQEALPEELWVKGQPGLPSTILLYFIFSNRKF